MPEPATTQIQSDDPATFDNSAALATAAQQDAGKGVATTGVATSATVAEPPAKKVSMDDFLKETTESVFEAVTSVAEQKRAKEEADAKKQQDAELAKQAAAVDKTKVADASKAASTTQAVSQQVQQRDYTGLNPDEVAYFKKMSNDAFNYLKPALLKHRQDLKVRDTEIQELKSGRPVIPQSYLEHPEGYVLLPEYKQVASQVSLASAIQEHYKEQLKQIRLGNDFVPLGQDAQGNVIKLPARKATQEDEEPMLQNLMFAAKQLSQVQLQQQAFVGGFKERQTQSMGALTKGYNDFFAGYDKPEHPYNKKKEEVKGMFDPMFHNNPLFPMLSSAITAIWELKDALLQKKAIDAATIGTQDDQRKAGPNSDSTTTTVTSGATGAKKVNFADFESEKAA